MRNHKPADDLERSNRDLREIRRNLRTIVVFYEPALNGNCSDDENDRKAQQTSGEPAQLAAIAARGDAYADLHFWCRYILDEVNEGTIGTLVRPEIPNMVEFIERWTSALLDQWPDDAANLKRDTAKHAHKLEALARGWSVKRIEIGPCPELTLTLDEHGNDVQRKCDGGLWAILQSTDTMLPKRIVCDQEAKHQWSPHSWRDLGRRLADSLTQRLQPSPSDAQSPPSSAESPRAS